MATLKAGDRAPKEIKFLWTLKSGLNAILIDSVRLMITFPRSTTSVEWDTELIPGETTATVVAFRHVLAADGSDAVHGTYWGRVWAYQGTDIVDDSPEFRLECDPSKVEHPA